MTINTTLSKEKGLYDTSIYNELCKNYKYLLEYYLSTVINFKKYEEKINNSNLYIGKNFKYKYLNEYLDLDYIFLINNLFIEKLNKNDIDLLKEFNKNKISDNMIDMIKRTFKEIIYDNYLNNEYTNKIYKVCYGAFIPHNFVDNDSLVLKIYYGKNTKNIDGNEFIKIDEKQLDFFNDLMKELKKEIKDKLMVKCEILLEKDIF